MTLASAQPPVLVLKDVRKSYGRNEVLKGISLEIQKGELVTFVGPSGCGKTTLLRIIGGFTEATSGDIILDGRRINDLPPNRRDTRICFQNYALFPHMTVGENVGYALRIRKWPKDRINSRVRELLDLVKLHRLEHRRIDELSGGQQQRVALARALSLEPKVLLLDEPLSNLDANLRMIMRQEIRNIQERIQVTTIFVTHDQYEAMSISDRLVVLHKGVIQQIGMPVEVYERPANEFVAGFVGHVNFVEGRLESADPDMNTLCVKTAFGRLQVDRTPNTFHPGENVVLVVRPEAVSIRPPIRSENRNTFEGVVQSEMYAGSYAKYVVRLGAGTIMIDHYNPLGARKYGKDDEVAVVIPRSVHLLRRPGGPP